MKFLRSEIADRIPALTYILPHLKHQTSPSVTPILPLAGGLGQKLSNTRDRAGHPRRYGIPNTYNACRSQAHAASGERASGSSASAPQKSARSLLPPSIIGFEFILECKLADE